MTRALFQYLLPVLLPTAIFIAWLAFTHSRGADQSDFLSRLREGPWYWLTISGFLLMIAGLVYTGLSQGPSPGGAYHAPRFESGRIVPGHVE